ncbi:MAG: UDP-N-acetylglucosamine 1-carboxyvinyltransferase [Proteobacteria bacterium]|nr:UDP-N-acetylglucosamine 1-carboxyvinyltransferase [Pseudomonadota bacterium]
MDKFVIKGGYRLTGEVEISGAKNAGLPLMSACLLTDKECVLEGIPNLKDIETMGKLLTSFGSEIERDKKGNLKIKTVKIKNHEAPYDLVRTMRASVLALGPLVARDGVAKISMPGGCAIGDRPINLHINALKKMGAKIEQSHGYIIATAKRLKGAKIYFDTQTVTGTENIIMAGVLAKGETIIENAAKEPEVVDLVNFLKKMGAKIEGEGTSVIRIEGVDSLGSACHRVIPDRIEAGTYIIATAATCGNVLIKNCEMDHLDALEQKLVEAGVTIQREKNGVRVIGKREIKSVDITTMPYPGFPTDLQAQFMAFMTIAKGLSVIRETIFENRFIHVSELKRMGADITIKDRNAIVKGVEGLNGAPVMVSDLRAGAALVIAGLIAEGETEVLRIYHLDRGYEAMEKKLSKLGAKIKRLKE